MKERIDDKNLAAFDNTIQLLLSRKVLNTLPDGKFVLKSTGETEALFSASIVWQMIDSYYASLLFTLSMLKNKGVEYLQISKKIQWLSEELYDEKVLPYFESCN